MFAEHAYCAVGSTLMFFYFFFFIILIRTADIDRRTQRSWNKIAAGRHLKTPVDESPRGLLNAAPARWFSGPGVETATSTSYGKRSERRVGVDSDIDARGLGWTPGGGVDRRNGPGEHRRRRRRRRLGDRGVDYRLVSADRYDHSSQIGRRSAIESEVMDGTSRLIDILGDFRTA
jgi:hypothetical protein